MSTNDVNIKALESIEASGIALSTAQKLAEAVDQEKRAAATQAPGIVDALVAGNLIQEHERAPATVKLASHDGAMQLIGNLLSYIGQQKTAYDQKLALVDQGQLVESGQEKAAGFSPHIRNPNYVGSRAGLGEKKASDKALLDGLGLS